MPEKVESNVPDVVNLATETSLSLPEWLELPAAKIFPSAWITTSRKSSVSPPWSWQIFPSPEKVVSNAPAVVKRATSPSLVLSQLPTTTILPLVWISTPKPRSWFEKSVRTQPSPPPNVVSNDPVVVNLATKRSPSGCPQSLVPTATIFPSV